MSAKRVVFVCSSTAWGGTENWTLRAAEGLCGSGHRVTLALRNPDIFLARMHEELPIVKLPFRNDTDLGTVLRLAALFRRKADAVVLTRVRDYSLGGLAARLAGKPALLRLGVVRNLREYHPMDFLRYGLLPSMMLVNACAIRDTLADTSWIDLNKVRVIYNGVDAPGRAAPEVREAMRGETGVRLDDILIVGAGRLAVEKRWSWLVEATARLVGEGLPVQVRLLGDGSERAALEALVDKHGLGERVKLVGTQTDVTPWFGAADIVTLPSSNEGISNTMLEAMGLGVPVVATVSGGVEEHFEDGQDLLLAGTDDFGGYVDRLRRLAEDPGLRASIGERGYARVLTRFSWDRMTAELGALLDSMTEATQ